MDSLSYALNPWHTYSCRKQTIEFKLSVGKMVPTCVPCFSLPGVVFHVPLNYVSYLNTVAFVIILLFIFLQICLDFRS